MKTWISCLAFLLIGSALGFYWMAQHSAHPATKERKSAEASSDDTRQSSDGQEHIAMLEAALAQTRERLEHLEAASQTPKEPAPSVVSPTAETQSPNPEQLEEQYKDRAKSFDSEPREERWAAPEEKKIASTAFATLPKGARLERGSCRTSLCKYELSFADRGEQRIFGQNFVHSMDSDGVLGYHFEQGEERADGTFPLQLLVFRSGFAMPGLTPE